tara:strand:+ start:1499 stop:1798 length:300 start_codon:yes stop_codon:yes gene_type:complete
MKSEKHIRMIQKLRDNIEKLDKLHHIHIFKLVIENKVEYTENTNGIFINLSHVSKKVVDKISKYISYVSLQELELNDIETKKSEYKKEFYNNNKEMPLY